MYIHVHNVQVHMYINVNYCLWNIRCIKTFYERLFEKRDEVLELSEALILALDAKGAVPWICLLFHPKKGLNYSYTFSSVKYKGFFSLPLLNLMLGFFPDDKQISGRWLKNTINTSSIWKRLLYIAITF